MQLLYQTITTNLKKLIQTLYFTTFEHAKVVINILE